MRCAEDVIKLFPNNSVANRSCGTISSVLCVFVVRQLCCFVLPEVVGINALCIHCPSRPNTGSYRTTCGYIAVCQVRECQCNHPMFCKVSKEERATRANYGGHPSLSYDSSDGTGRSKTILVGGSG